MSTLRWGCSKAIPKVAIPFSSNCLNGTGNRPSLWHKLFKHGNLIKSCPRFANMIYEVKNITDLQILMNSFNKGLNPLQRDYLCCWYAYSVLRVLSLKIKKGSTWSGKFIWSNPLIMLTHLRSWNLVHDLVIGCETQWGNSAPEIMWATSSLQLARSTIAYIFK